MPGVAQHTCGVWAKDCHFRRCRRSQRMLARSTSKSQGLSNWPTQSHSASLAVTCSGTRQHLLHPCRSASNAEPEPSGNGQHSTSAAAAAFAGACTMQPCAHAEEAVAAGGAAPTDWIIQGTFVLAITALSIVTLGVAYLAIASFLDKRTEDEERKRFEAAQKTRDMQQAMGGAAKAPKRKRTAEELTRGGGRGFGQ